jgi:ribosomal protein S12 methylthiotransferase accessory factor
VAGSPPLLVDVTTDLGVPVVLAFSAEPSPLALMPGVGASLDPLYAVERALDELLQICAAARSNPGLRRETTARAARLAPWPQLRAAFEVDRRTLGALGVEASSIVGAAREHRQGGMPALLEILDKLEERGYEAYGCSWTPPESFVSVQCVLVPGLESFFLVQLGIPVLPTARGARVVAAT